MFPEELPVLFNQNISIPPDILYSDICNASDPSHAWIIILVHQQLILRKENIWGGTVVCVTIPYLYIIDIVGFSTLKLLNSVG